VVRSYDRLPALCELVERLLAQDHESFEIVVVEQTTEAAPGARARLDALAADARVRVLAHGPLGSARARNVGVAAARGEIVVLVDDDDLPVGRDWLARLTAPFSDPRCLGVTCRHVWRDDDRPSPLYRRLAARRCLRFSPLLRLPWTFVRHDAPVAPVDYVHGTGGAVRKSAVERFGAWDADAPLEDESSFGYRVQRGKAPDEYFAFDPGALLRRRLDLDGGMAKRGLTPAAFYGKTMTFVRRIVGRYHPRRVRWLYPLYALACLRWTLEWLWSTSRRHRTPVGRAAASLAITLAAPLLAARLALREPVGGAQPR
jgi:glycosyltransferase involved in cell wall biosynthesis